ADTKKKRRLFQQPQTAAIRSIGLKTHDLRSQDLFENVTKPPNRVSKQKTNLPLKHGARLMGVCGEERDVYKE
ncbi:MAG: hypothetical protein AAB385_10510, partial [Planctomycetota bacterium]